MWLNTHSIMYLSMTVNTTIPPSCWCHNLCSGWRHTLFSRPTRGSGGHSHFPSIKLNFVSHSDQSQLLVHHDKPAPHHHHHPLSTIHPWHSASHSPPSSRHAALPLFECKWGHTGGGKEKKKKKSRKEQRFGPSSNKCPMQRLEQKKKKTQFVLFKM